MILPRVIPVLLLQGRGLVKGQKFSNHTYVGDPINAVQIFNSKDVDEIIFLDINASREGRIPDLELVQAIADQCLVPFAVGGGIKSLKDAQAVLASGAEKVCICSAALENPAVVSEISNYFGAQSIVVSVDVRRALFGGYKVYSRCGTKAHRDNLFDYVRQLEKLGVGEVLINNIDRDGTRSGYDIDLLSAISSRISVPVIGGCGAGSYLDLAKGLNAGGCSAVAAGSLFVHFGSRRAVLISYPEPEELGEIVKVA